VAQPLSVTTRGPWQAQGTTVREVLAAVERLRRQPVRTDLPLRTPELTLVVVTSSEAEATAAREAVHALSEHHPAHTLVMVVARPAGPGRLDAEVRVRAVVAGELAVHLHDIRLWVGGPAAGHLDSVVEPLTEPDLPLVLWPAEGLPELDEPLLRRADRLIVDSRRFIHDVDRLRDLVQLTRRLPVTDLSWVALRGWRDLVAGLFEGAAFRPFVQGVRHARVAGGIAPRRLLAGWLASRLRLPVPLVEALPADAGSLELVAEYGGRGGRFAVEGPDAAFELRARAEIAGPPSRVRTLRLTQRTEQAVLAQALTCFETDPVYEEALAAVVALWP
jgi:glucose-6-phosphate dehydrogenase assembly protein OpcA